MIGTAAGLILGFLLSIGIGCAFHLIFGGSATRLLIYIVAAQIGFLIGHLIGQGLRIELWRLGVLYLFPAMIGSIVLLFIVRWLWPERPASN